MSLSSEITRLQNAKSALKTSIEAKGVTVSDSTLISGYAALVDEIQTGGGGGDDILRDLIERDIKTFNIPSGTRQIGRYAFNSCSGLTSVTIPNSVVAIGSNAFSACRGLTSVGEIGSGASEEIPNSIESIDEYAFYSCSGLTSVTIPNSVVAIGNYAFYSCSGLTSVTIPNSIESIGNYAFSSCEKLTNIIVPNYIPYVSENAFNNCKSLPVENYVKYASTWAFQYDSSQTSYTLREDTTYLVGTFSYCKKITSVGEIGSGASVEIPNSVVAIGYKTFNSCSGLTSVTIPNSVVAIGSNAFSFCSGLTSVTIPNSVVAIGEYTFYNCNGLTSVTIGNGVTSIGEGVFYNCNGLTSVTIQATTPPTLSNKNAFYNTNNCPIYVPAESVNAYKTATNWSSLASRIQSIVA